MSGAAEVDAAVATAKAAYPAWRALEVETGTSLIHLTGGLDFGPPDRTSWASTRAALAEARVPFEELDGAEIHRRFPQFNLPDEIATLYQPDAGVLHADRCVAALADTARRAGAEIHEAEQVVGIRPTLAGVEIDTTDTTYGAGAVVLALGAWTRPMLATIGLDISLEMMKQAEQKIGAFPAARGLVRGNIAQMPFPSGAVDVVTCVRLFGHFPGNVRVTMLREIARVSRGPVIVQYF